MSKWTNVYNWIKRLRTPSWIKLILDQIQATLWQVLYQVGKDVVENIKSEIIRVAGEGGMTGKEKFNAVVDYARKTYPIAVITDSTLNLLIEALVSLLKKEKIIT